MLLDAFDAYLLDLDGIVYVGGQALPGAPGTVAELRGRGRIVRFLTNDPRPTRAELAERLTALGIPAQPKDVITAGWATAAWLGRQGLWSAFAPGGPGLASELTAAGITLVDRTPSAAPPHEISDCAGAPDAAPPHEISDFAGAPDAALHEAARHDLADARFVATNPDPWFPGEEGRRPATGAIVAALREVTGVSPAVVGKPELPMFEAALRELPAVRAPSSWATVRTPTWPARTGRGCRRCSSAPRPPRSWPATRAVPTR